MVNDHSFSLALVNPESFCVPPCSQVLLGGGFLCVHRVCCGKVPQLFKAAMETIGPLSITFHCAVFFFPPFSQVLGWYHVGMHFVRNRKIPGFDWTKLLHFMCSWEVQHCDSIDLGDSVHCLCGWHIQRRNWLKRRIGLRCLCHWKVQC